MVFILAGKRLYLFNFYFWQNATIGIFVVLFAEVFRHLINKFLLMVGWL